MVLSTNKWLGKVAIVTGAAAGIGSAITDALIENGLIVVGVDLLPEEIAKKAKTMTGKKGKLYALQCDVSKEKDILRVFDWTRKNLGPVHILINNAGKAGETTLTNGNTEIWRSLINTNFLGLAMVSKQAIKIMKENQICGHIVNINSILGHRVVYLPNANVYPATKFAVTALSETMRQELNHLGLKIKVTSVSPGFVSTNITTVNKTGSPEKKSIFKEIPFLKCEDIADAVIYALSTPEHVEVKEVLITAMFDP